MNIKVKNCNDCPFKSFGGYEGEYNICSLDKEKGNLNNGTEYFGKVKEIPDWCKLKEDKITVEFK